MTLTIGIDVGGTKVAGGVVDEHGTVLASNRRATPADDQAGTRDTIVEVAAELAAHYPTATAIGIGAAAWIDVTGSTVLFAPNLAWRDEPLQAYVSKATGLPVVLDNDANVAGWAEFRFGVAKHADSMVMITVGTGIGGAVVINGKLWHGAHGIAAELGHIQSVPDGHPCGCGRLGCLEQYASGNALVRFGRAGARQEPDRAAKLLELAGGDALAITGRQITEAARAGDGVAMDAFAQVGYWLGVALADLAQSLDPDIMVIGGGVIDAGPLLMGPAERAYREQLANRDRFPVAEIHAASTGNDAGVVGAADLARGI
ncbi:ROK family glucokinase [Actinoplanes derwentensis]|uniref:Glucokinase n=1 Tax=Actinoplanes derwentensis TaxID=113562 RepID=A0A1H2C230_9ACTN|nr:ROK family glucokinase [Actinoplanes derwentensis]GID84695.1 glucokinase [Actinoplanes derwentensis]SDT64347.1 glucokinase [Actinoplanes derwentensis]